MLKESKNSYERNTLESAKDVRTDLNYLSKEEFKTERTAKGPKTNTFWETP